MSSLPDSVQLQNEFIRLCQAGMILLAYENAPELSDKLFGDDFWALGNQHLASILEKTPEEKQYEIKIAHAYATVKKAFEIGEGETELKRMYEDPGVRLLEIGAKLTGKSYAELCHENRGLPSPRLVDSLVLDSASVSHSFADSKQFVDCDGVGFFWTTDGVIESAVVYSKTKIETVFPESIDGAIESNTTYAVGSEKLDNKISMSLAQYQLSEFFKTIGIDHFAQVELHNPDSFTYLSLRHRSHHSALHNRYAHEKVVVPADAVGIRL